MRMEVFACGQDARGPRDENQFTRFGMYQSQHSGERAAVDEQTLPGDEPRVA